MNKNQEQIWRYLSGEMPSEEKLSFEQELDSNSALRSALNEEKELLQFLKNKEAKTSALTNLADIHQESISIHSNATAAEPTITTEKAPQQRRAIIKWLIPAAIAATIALGYIFLPTDSSTPQELYASHFEPSEVSFSTRGDNNEAMLAKVAQLFNAGSYDSTVGFIEKLSEDIQAQDKIRYTKAISYIATQRNAEGRNLLNELPALYGDEVGWYKALSYLQESNVTEAVTALQSISPKFNRYDSVSTLLKQLQ